MNTKPKLSVHRILLALTASVAVLQLLAIRIHAGESIRIDDKQPIASSGIESQDFWTRNQLLGDTFGLRPLLEEQGITWELTYTDIYAGLFSGGVRDRSFDHGHRIDALIRTDLETLGLWEGGGFQVHLESKWGESPERAAPRSGGIWPQNTGAVLPLGDPERLVASSLFFTQRIGDSGTLMFGKINAVDLLAGDPFFGGWARDRFSNIAFVAPPSGVVPPVIMGAIYNHRHGPFTTTFMAFDPNDRTNDYWPSDLFEDGVNLSLGTTWAGPIAGRPSTLGITGTYSTKEGADLQDFLLPPDIVGGTKEGSYNVAVSASHLFWESPDHPGKGFGIYVRAGIADGNPNPIDALVVGGIAGYGLCPHRTDDVFGIGFYHYDLSEALKSGLSPLVPLENEQGLEVFYRFEVTPWFHLSADVQWIEPARSNFPNAWVGGLRGVVNF